MREKKSYHITLDSLVEDMNTEENLAAILNFLERTKNLISILYWSERSKNKHEEGK